MIAEQRKLIERVLDNGSWKYTYHMKRKDDPYGEIDFDDPEVIHKAISICQEKLTEGIGFVSQSNEAIGILQTQMEKVLKQIQEERNENESQDN